MRTIVNWKLCDYTYCPDWVRKLSQADISIQEPLSALAIQLPPILGQAAQVVYQIIEQNREEIMAVQGGLHNSLYLLLDCGLDVRFIDQHLVGQVDLDDLFEMDQMSMGRTLHLGRQATLKLFASTRLCIHRFLDNKECLKKDVQACFMDQPYTFDELVSLLVWQSDPSILKAWLDQWVKEGKLSYARGKYHNTGLNVYASLSEVIDLIHDEILTGKLYGQSDEALAESLEMSPKLVGEHFKQVLSSLPSVKEDAYVPLLETYQLDKALFYHLTQAMEPTYGYLYARFGKQFKQAKPVDLSIGQSKLINPSRFESYRDQYYAYIADRWVKKDDDAAILEAFCASFSGYFSLKALEAAIGKTYPGLRKPYLIIHPQKGYRYRPLTKQLAQWIIQGAQLSNYQNTIVSAKKLYEANQDWFISLDIRDASELHALLKNIQRSYPELVQEMEVVKNPMIQFGQVQRVELLAQDIQQLAPIELDAFLDTLVQRDGYDKATLKRYLYRHFSYLIEGAYLYAPIEIDDQLKEKMNKPFYFDKEVAHLETGMLRQLGYHRYDGFILRDDLNPTLYFEQWILEHLENLPGPYGGLSSYEAVYKRLCQEGQIVELDDRVVSYTHFMPTKKAFDQLRQDWLDQIPAGIGNAHYWQLPYPDSVYRPIPGIQSQRMGDGWLLSKQTINPIQWLTSLLVPGLKLAGLQAQLAQAYHIHIDRSALIHYLEQAGLGVSPDTDRIGVKRFDSPTQLSLF